MGRKRDLKAEEADLWRQVMKDVERLPGREFQSLISREPVSVPKMRRALTAAPLPSHPPAQKPKSSLMPLTHGEAAGVDRKTQTRLRQGKLPIEGRLDLHGMTQDEAQSALSSFVRRASGAGKRCVLVITGKGLRQDGEVGVLRRNVPHWLNRSPLRELVLSFSYAHRKDGGEGALYIFLKRKRVS